MIYGNDHLTFRREGRGGEGVYFFLIKKMSPNFREKIIDKNDAKNNKSDGAVFRREIFDKMTPQKNTDFLLFRVIHIFWLREKQAA